MQVLIANCLFHSLNRQQLPQPGYRLLNQVQCKFDVFGVVCFPRLKPDAASLSFRDNPIAVRTCDGSIAPENTRLRFTPPVPSD